MQVCNTHAEGSENAAARRAGKRVSEEAMNIDDIMSEDVEGLADETGSRKNRRVKREHVADEASVMSPRALARQEKKAAKEKAAEERAALEKAAKEKAEREKAARKAAKKAKKSSKSEDWDDEEEYDEYDEYEEYDTDADDDEDDYDVKPGKIGRIVATEKAGAVKRASADEGEDDEDEKYAYDAEAEDGEEAGDGENSDEEQPQKSRFRAFLGEVLFFVVSFAVIYLLFYVFPPYLVSGSSMNKTLVDKAFGFGFRFVTPERGDIVIINTGDRDNGTDGENFIKRVIGVPGDTIKYGFESCETDTTLPDGTVIPAGGMVYRVYINGELEQASYAFYGGGSSAFEGECTLGEDEYFVMGDNRLSSHDSRAIGPVKRDEIICKMMIFFWGKQKT